MNLTGGTDVRRVARPSLAGRVADGALVVLVLLAVPAGILLIGAPIALLIGAAVNLAHRLLG